MSTYFQLGIKSKTSQFELGCQAIFSRSQQLLEIKAHGLNTTEEYLHKAAIGNTI